MRYPSNCRNYRTGIAIDGPLKSMGQRGRNRHMGACHPGQSRYELSVALGCAGRSCHNRTVGGREWLKKLGMAEHLQRFVENRIDLSVLPDPTDQDLEKLAALLGDRRKMLGAIRDLDSVSVAPAAAPMPAASEPA
jgi:hypothetical protein